jgi:lysyl-tRNA synthetase class 2
MFTRIPVDSSVIAAVAYSADAALDIEFTSGARYRYFAVPAQLFHEFLSADSKGVFFNRRIRPCYPCAKLDARPSKIAVIRSPMGVLVIAGEQIGDF